MAKPTYAEYWPIAAVRWDNLRLQAATSAEVKITANKLLGYKSRYQAIEKLTGVPWYVIAVLHERESDADFTKQLAQGDPLSHQSTHEPIAGPFKTFEDSAVWALDHDHLMRVIDWRIEKILYWCEEWNGWGVWLYHPQVPSSYIWGGTNIQKAGKYVADHVWSSTAWDIQIGCAALLYQLAQFDSSIKFVRETPLGTPGDVAAPVPPPKPNGAKPLPPVEHTTAPPPPKPPLWVHLLDAIIDWLKK